MFLLAFRFLYASLREPFQPEVLTLGFELSSSIESVDEKIQC